MFDSVNLQFQREMPSQKILRNMNDLQNLYDLLVRVYKEEKIDPNLPEGEKDVRRYPIYDNTSGTGKYFPREVLTSKYISYILNKYDIKLQKVRGPIRRYASKDKVKDAEAVQLGMKWIEENGLEKRIRYEVAYRLKQMRENPDRAIRPYFALKKEEREQVEAELAPYIDLPEAEEWLKKIAKEMVANYQNKYYVYQKIENEEK